MGVGGEGGGDGGEGGMGGEGGVSGGEGGKGGAAQTSIRSKPHPVPLAQPPSSSVTVHSLAPTPSQMASAWAKLCL